MISALKAKRLLHKGIEAYLAQVVDVNSESDLKKCASSAKILEYVFQEFIRFATRSRVGIWDLIVVGFNSHFYTTYRMASAELKELKNPIARSCR